jgi:hypothetical protein
LDEKEKNLVFIAHCYGNRLADRLRAYVKRREETFRIAHMGDLTPDEVRELLQNIDEILGG